MESSDEKDAISVSIEDLEDEVKNNIIEFNRLLDSLSTLHDKKKSLWRQIYNNAILDRKNAYIIYSDLCSKVHGNPGDHAVHGPTLAKYLERMEKSNTQLIKLAEILDDAVEQDEDDLTDPQAFYENMEKFHTAADAKAKKKKEE